MDSQTLNNHVILVTGAANGIGAAVAFKLATQGAELILLDKDIPGLERTYDRIAEHCPQPAIYPLDLKGATVDDYDALRVTIEQQYGRLDGLVHCAAQLGQLAPVEHQNPKIWAETLHVNLTAPFLLTRSCLPLLKSAPTAILIFTTDTHKDKAYWSGYGLAKSGIETLSKQLHDELENEGKIQVHCLDPGQVQTALLSRAFPGLDPNNFPSPDAISQQYLDLFKVSLTA